MLKKQVNICWLKYELRGLHYFTMRNTAIINIIFIERNKRNLFFQKWGISVLSFLAFIPKFLLSFHSYFLLCLFLPFFITFFHADVFLFILIFLLKVDLFFHPYYSLFLQTLFPSLLSSFPSCFSSISSFFSFLFHVENCFSVIYLEETRCNEFIYIYLKEYQSTIRIKFMSPLQYIYIYIYIYIYYAGDSR